MKAKFSTILNFSSRYVQQYTYSSSKYIKNGGCLGLKGQIKVFFSNDTTTKLSINNLAETINCAYKLWKIWGFLNILVAILCFANSKVRVNKYRMLSDRFEFSTHKLYKNKWIIKYTLKFRAKFHVSDFSPG